MGLPAARGLRCRSRKHIRLGPVRIDIRSNEPDFKGFRFFTESGIPAASPAECRAHEPHFRLNLCNLRLDGHCGDVERFSTQVARMRTQLRTLIGGSCCYYVSCDIADMHNLKSIGSLLKAARAP